MSQQGTADKRKHVTLIIHEKPEIKRRLESGESQREVMAHTALDCQNCLWYEEIERPIMIIYGIK